MQPIASASGQQSFLIIVWHETLQEQWNWLVLVTIGRWDTSHSPVPPGSLQHSVMPMSPQVVGPVSYEILITGGSWLRARNDQNMEN